MDLEMVLDWLGHLDSRSPPKPESVVWPPTPQTHGYYLRLKRKAQAEQQQNQPCAVAHPAFDYSATMPVGTRGSKKKKVSELGNGQDQKATREARFRGRAKRAALISPAESAGSVSGNSEAVQQAEAAQTRADMNELDEQQRPAFPGPDWTTKGLPILSTPPPCLLPLGKAPESTLAPSTLAPSTLAPSTLAPSTLAPSTLAPSTKAPSTTGQGPTRSRSPMKRAVNLNKLGKPVSWSTMDTRELEARMTDSEFANLYQSIMAAQTKGYLPKELYSVLKAEMPRVKEDEKDSRFAERPVRPNPTQLDLGVTTLVQKPGFRLPQPIQEDEKSQLLASYHTLSLAIELETLRDIRKETKEHIDKGLVEVSWNEGVHKAMLKLATQHTPSVCAANVTRAVIMKDYLPKTSTSTQTISLPADSKIIDYVIAIRPGPNQPITDKRIARFLEKLDYPSFNQSNCAPLQTMPSGVFIETKTGTNGRDEAKTQLGIWLASWYERVSKFPCSDVNKAPSALPLIIVSGEVWDLWFAFNKDSEYEVCGPFTLGSTHQLQGLYQILAVLRVLVQWMATDFHKWVAACLETAGV